MTVTPEPILRNNRELPSKLPSLCRAVNERDETLTERNLLLSMLLWRYVGRLGM